MPGSLGGWELIIILVVVLVIFGPKRLPEMGRSLGKAIREFKKRWQRGSKRIHGINRPRRGFNKASNQRH